jgi:hypothetical protein
VKIDGRFLCINFLIFSIITGACRNCKAASQGSLSADGKCKVLSWTRCLDGRGKDTSSMFLRRNESLVTTLMRVNISTINDIQIF